MVMEKYEEMEKELVFRNLNISLQQKHVLKNISGVARSKEILGVFGPKGAGKTTLVETLAGQLKPYVGDVLLCGTPVEHTRAEVSLVQATDLHLPTLTVLETLKYSAILRLHTNPTKDIEFRLRHVIDLCQLDAFKDLMIQFLPVPARKRTSLACELLLNPSVLIIDDPVTSMDYKDAIGFLKLLRHYAEKFDKVVIASLPAAPSAFYSVCHNQLFLYSGHIAYYGTADKLPTFLKELELFTPEGYNPADYMLELLNEDTLDDRSPIQEKIVQEMYKRRQEPGWECKSFLNKYPITCHHKHAAKNGNGTKKFETSLHVENEEVEILLENSAPDSSVFDTTFCHQFRVLLCRNFHNARRRILNPISLIQNFYILVICVLIWWRPERVENEVMDRMGLFFFTVVQWAFFALLDAILTFPKELKVINRERKFRQYRLSAFCLSKFLSEIPLAILQPCLFMVVIYWVANLNGVSAFLASTGVLIIDVLAAQSIGVFIGSALQPPWTVTIVSLGLLSMMLWGGAFNTPPSWLSWGKYASFFFYGLQALIVLEFKDAPPIKCLPNSTLPVCNMVNPATNSTAEEFDSEVILMVQKITWPVWKYIGVLLGIMVVTRVLWYIVMRRQKIHRHS
ncbi:uncharacterized protein LOC125666450 [Ostrea edulis]|uniref:uncharacterized protein LOC125666450 n=1 Tax=Ostrea edulis TaxID=37623 RepID=UPI0024AEF311|nr:uncharacterized protein LOC125666450 [Ostrea edulis]